MSAVATDDHSGGPTIGRHGAGRDPFMRTRFAVPARPPTFMRRERLVGKLDEGVQRPLTMVSGAAGAGKTLLVADWALGLDQPVAWLTVDAADQAPGVFWSYVLEAVRVSGVRISQEIDRPADASRVDDRLLAWLAADLGDRSRPAIVVLDEYERLAGAAQIADQLQFLLHHAGQALRLVLVTRTEPLLPLHRYRLDGSMTEIRGAELAFTPEEATTLLGLHGLQVSDGAAQALVERTQGWAAGLRLGALAAQQSGDPDTYLKEFEAGESTIADFLLAEVLKKQPDATQDLLLRVSTVNPFTPALANALTGRTDAEQILAGLQRDNAFVEPLGHGCYRLHPLFAEILRSHLRLRSPGLDIEMHRRASRWLSRYGSLAETLAHGAAAGDWDFTAGALVDELAIGELFTGLESNDLAELFSRMAPETASPAAELVFAASGLLDHDLERGLRHLRQAEEALEADPADPADMAAAQLSCALLETLAARLTGSPGRAEKAAEAAEELRPCIPDELLSRHPEVTALLQTHLGSSRLWAGRFEDARLALSAAAASPGGVSTALPRQESLGHLALIEYLNGWTGRAQRHARAAMSEAERFSVPHSSGSSLGLLVLAAIAVDRNELREAKAHLDRATSTSNGAGDPVVAAGRAIIGSRLLLACGKPQAALTATATPVPAAVASPWAQEHAALVSSAAYLAEGDTKAALDVVARAAEHGSASAVAAAQAQLAAGHHAEALILLDGVPVHGGLGPAVTVRATLARAQAADQAGDAARARRLVAQALLDARRDRLRRPFLEIRPWIRSFLGSDPVRGLADGWLLQGQGQGQGQGPQAEPGPDREPPRTVMVEQLSSREREVLQRLAQVMSTEEIAADLYLSVNTVKTHLKSIYRKLGVNRRSDAVRRARELRQL
ncbi:LuxR C-terminal-related transcriptional regulator [Streptomyces sp. NPDC097981]|uniref:LuxR C-terminal-related transcriptional regulator n=1 Tax=Streptomyces sp. NPDC097981 TaxID=3155428 RepID=UPI00331CB6F2